MGDKYINKVLGSRPPPIDPTNGMHKRIKLWLNTPTDKEITMDEIIKQLGDKWPFKYHYCEDGEVLEKQPVAEEPIEEAPF